jgi:predicted lipoprotein with Yx(FWY)xxD motif
MNASKTAQTTRPRLRRRSKVILGAAALAAAIAAVGAYAYVHYVSVVRYTSGHGQVTVESKAVDGHGTVLVTNKGFALYTFPPDAARHVTCTGGCASAWPPLRLHAGETAAAGAGVRADLLGTAPDPGGGRVITYHGWPLYTYLGDASPGHAAGQGKNDDGGYWYVMRPSGQIVGP